jgi:hypothetical protein
MGWVDFKTFLLLSFVLKQKKQKFKAVFISSRYAPSKSLDKIKLAEGVDAFSGLLHGAL